MTEVIVAGIYVCPTYKVCHVQMELIATLETTLLMQYKQVSLAIENNNILVLIDFARFKALR